MWLVGTHLDMRLLDRVVDTFELELAELIQIQNLLDNQRDN